MINKFPKRLRCLREDKHMTQETLGEVLHVARCTVAGYETRGRMPDAETLCMIADFFNVSVDYLLGRTNKKATLK